MKDQTLKAKIMQFISAIGFKLFIWGNQTTPEKYWQEIWEQESTHRAKHFTEQPEEQSILHVEGMTEMEQHFFEIHQEFNPGLSDMDLLKSFYREFPTIKNRIDRRKNGQLTDIEKAGQRVKDAVMKFPEGGIIGGDVHEYNGGKFDITPMWLLDDNVYAFPGDEVYVMLKNKFGYFKKPKLEIAREELFGSENLPAICTEAVFFSDKKAAKEHKTLHNRKINEAYLKSQEEQNKS